MPRTVLVVVHDLIFATKILSTARSLGVPVATARDLDAVQAHINSGDVSMVMLDLNTDVLDPLAALRVIRRASSPLRVVAFLAHVQKELADAARAEGADYVLPRSSFTVHLPVLLQAAAQ